MYSKIIIAVTCLVAFASLVQGQDPKPLTLTKPVTETKINQTCSGTIDVCCGSLINAHPVKGQKCCTELRTKCAGPLVILVGLLVLLGLLLGDLIILILAVVLQCICDIVIVIISILKLANPDQQVCTSRCMVIKEACMTRCRGISGITQPLLAVIGLLLDGCMSPCSYVV